MIDPLAWTDAKTHSGPGLTAYVRTSDFEATGNNEGTIAYEVAVRSDDGELLLHETLHADWNHYSSLGVEFDAEGASVTLTPFNGDGVTHELSHTWKTLALRQRLDDRVKGLVDHFRRSVELSKDNPVLEEGQDGKDAVSGEALYLMGRMIAEAGEWAIDHETGKVALGVHQTLPKQGSMDVLGISDEVKRDLDQLYAIANDPQAEVRGEALRQEAGHRELAPQLQRQMLVNVLSRLNEGAQLRMLEDLIFALDALNSGEVLDLLRGDGDTTAFTCARYKLKALQYAEYVRAKAEVSSDDTFVEHVIEAFGLMEPEATRLKAGEWRQDAVEALGIMVVERDLSHARGQGQAFGNITALSLEPGPGQASQLKWLDGHGARGEREHGLEALQDFGRRYQQILKDSSADRAWRNVQY